MQDWMIVAVIGIVVIFGASKLPQLARNVGKAQTEFKKGLKEGSAAEDASKPADPATPPAEPAAADPAAPVAEAPVSPPAAPPQAEQPAPIENPPAG